MLGGVLNPELYLLRV